MGLEEGVGLVDCRVFWGMLMGRPVHRSLLCWPASREAMGGGGACAVPQELGPRMESDI